MNCSILISFAVYLLATAVSAASTGENIGNSDCIERDLVSYN